MKLCECNMKKKGLSFSLYSFVTFFLIIRPFFSLTLSFYSWSTHRDINNLSVSMIRQFATLQVCQTGMCVLF